MQNYPALSLLAISLLCAQTLPPPGAPPPPSWTATASEGAPKTFEVASVKISKSLTSFGGMDYGPGHLALTNSTLAGLVTWAYGVKDYQVLAAPPWFRSDRYDVNAKAHGAPDLPHLKLLLQISAGRTISPHPPQRNAAASRLYAERRGARH
jgi:hypothetical protein